ncbi:Annexin A13 [Cyphellophora attinorum]|uniref:Annexin A13 n=1 Tax=Cyphellophora attinorum TaxID=1664694 RepID=A0A0N0NMB2_9EURO|nr:Annexin A13 [Phialophora attinorum]KPI40009.1 Annexin A13 [Phialophora attinorum]
MAYNQQNYGGYGGPPPQGGQPPYGQQQQQWGPPQGPPPNWQGGHNQYGPPQGGPPQQQWQQQPQQWNAPPGPPPGQQWGPPQGPPPGQQQQWSAPGGPPPGQFAPPPGPPGQNFGPPHGGPPQGGFGGPGAPGQPSLGYVFGTNEKELIRVLAPLDPLQVVTLSQTYSQIHRGRDLEKDIEDETSRYFKEALIALRQVSSCRRRHQRATPQHVVLGRSNADLRAIKETYQRLFSRRMEADVDGDLSMKTKDLFRIVLRANRAEENTPIDPQSIDRDVNELNRALASSGEQVAVCNIIALRSDAQLRAIAQAFQNKHRKPLRDKLERVYGGHMEDALLLMLDRATDPAMSDARMLEAAMAGMGTKDRLLVHRVVSCHWNRAHKDQVKRAYQHKYKKDLLERIRGETSGDYRNVLIACMA